MNLHEIAAEAKKSRRTVERWVSKKRRASLRLESKKVGGSRVVSETAWLKFKGEL